MFYPPLLVVLTKVLGAAYTPRYGWPAIFGMALGLVYLLSPSRRASAALLSALLIAFAYQGHNELKNLPDVGSTTVDNGWRRIAALCGDRMDVPVVVASEMIYLPAVQYSPPEFRSRLMRVVDMQRAIRIAGTDTVDNADGPRQFVPLQIEGLAPFQAKYQEFYLYSGGGYEWITQYLLEEKYNMRLQQKTVKTHIFRERQLATRKELQAEHSAAIIPNSAVLRSGGIECEIGH